MDHVLKKARRARRRDRTLTLARRRRDEHLARHHFDATTGLTAVDCVCELADTYFAKRTAFGCGCRKRRKGRPKVAAGMCNIGDRDRVIRWRQEARALRVAVTTGQWLDGEAGRRWPGSKPGPKTFTIEKRGIGRDGSPGTWWIEVRKYRTARDRDNALQALRKGVLCYVIRDRRPGEPAPYTGPRYEFRAGGSNPPDAA